MKEWLQLILVICLISLMITLFVVELATPFLKLAALWKYLFG